MIIIQANLPMLDVKKNKNQDRIVVLYVKIEL